jgi:hypothetical protein
MEKLIFEIEKWSETYEFNFQFWGNGNNNVFISKDEVELYSSGDHTTPKDVIIDALNYIHKINRLSKIK